MNLRTTHAKLSRTFNHSEQTSVFNTAFTIGYILTLLLELLLATILRLSVFALWEPEIFSLSPRVPTPILPWVLRENGYRPKRITLFVADFCTSCVAAPLIEETVKLKILQWSVRLPRNFRVAKRVKEKSQSSLSSKRKKKKTKKKKLVSFMEAISPQVLNMVDGTGKNEQPMGVTNINSYISHMLAASIGLKLSDSIRRVLMYTKKNDDHKGFYALFRGIFPIHELCGTLTSLQLAKRDILGVTMPLWKMIGPAVFIHAMANFRGMKPVFKWNSSTPWSEMQLSPW
eukprot:CAMPEP_0171326514 /NCGR_PEP_ID=MMETSP0816-20121228/117505_1 /TAXON_ID=420281 /ORGANISM="Proboscia inermis, Strain CCAP1064/1" /LENGTH=286 /DNA_ID=CAMNT_0011826009 /DNA_START=35 /DNA_END=892 /DNA_ORIENTATION=+